VIDEGAPPCPTDHLARSDSADGAGPGDPAALLEEVLRVGRSMARTIAGHVGSVPAGFVVTDARFPASWQHNRVVLTAPAEDPAGVRAAAGAALRAVGATHLRIDVEAPSTDVAALAGDDLTVGEERLLVRDGRAPGIAASRTASVVPYAALRAAVGRAWREDHPEATRDEVRQLVERETLWPAGTTKHVASLVGGMPAAWCAVRRAGDVAEIDGLVTLPEYRRQGHGTAVLAAALSVAADTRLVFLRADGDDWPREWYARHGFRDVGGVTVLHGTAERPAPPPARARSHRADPDPYRRPPGRGARRVLFATGHPGGRTATLELLRALDLETAGQPTILDVGCGRGHSVDLLVRAGAAAVGVDLDHRAVRRARRRRLPVAIADAHALPVADASLDAVLAEVAVGATDDPLLALLELARVLRPGGRLALGELVARDDALEQAWPDLAWSLGTLHALPSRERLAGWLEAAGLHVVAGGAGDDLLADGVRHARRRLVAPEARRTARDVLAAARAGALGYQLVVAVRR
jgi:SAM-dependent methyltransferase